MFQLFSKYLLIALSAMVLVAGAQQGLFNKQSSDFAYADCSPQNPCPPPQVPVPPAPVCPDMTCQYSESTSDCPSGSRLVTGTGASGFNQPGCTYVAGCSVTTCTDVVVPPPTTPPTPPAQVCTPGQFDRVCTGQCGGCAANAGEARVTQCRADGSGSDPVGPTGSECSTSCAGPCQVAPPPPPTPTACEANPNLGEVQQGCQGEQMCFKNRWQGTTRLADGTCQTGLGDLFCRPDSRCTSATPTQKLTCYICDLNRPAGDQRRIFGASNSYDSCNGVNGGEGNPSTDSSQSLCQTVTPPTPPPTTPPIICTPPMTLVNGLCQPPVSCPLGTTLTNGICQPNTVCPVGTLLTNGVCQPSTVCPAGTTLTNGVCQPPVIPGQGSTNITNNNTNSNTNSNTNTITISNPAPQVITAQAAPANFGNVGVGTSVVYTQGVQYVPAALPKTGLPEIAWSVLAFIPAGFKLRRFSKVKGDLENHPSYIWENRQFKA